MKFIEPRPLLGKQSPDLHGMLFQDEVLCEVKTINPSDQEVWARRTKAAHAIHSLLDQKFFEKLKRTLQTACAQLVACRRSERARLIVFVVINFDDAFHEGLEGYLAQIRERAAEWMGSAKEVVMSVTPEFYSATVDSPAALEIVCSSASDDCVDWTVDYR